MGAAAGKEALDEVGRFGVEAKAGEALGEDVMVDKVKEARYMTLVDDDEFCIYKPLHVTKAKTWWRECSSR